MSEDPRAASASALLREEGLADVDVRVAGHQAEIAVLSAPPHLWARLTGSDATRLIDGMKDLGFRYVTLDLDPAAR